MSLVFVFSDIPAQQDSVKGLGGKASKKSSADTVVQTQRALKPTGDTAKQLDKSKAPTGLRQPLPDSVAYHKKDFTAEELIRGERLFYGLVYRDKSLNCASCHNTVVSDTLNWNPDAIAISEKYLNQNALDLSRVLLKPVGQHLKAVHKNITLSAEDIALIKAYMNKLTEIGMVQPKPVVTNLLILIIASIIFLFAIGDLILKKVIKKTKVKWIIVLISGTVITWILAVNAIAFGRAKGFSPDQPIKFSHAVHAGQNKTDCVYCHYGARISKSAGIPSSSVCWNCHFLVRNGTRSGQWEISKIVAAIEQDKPVEWVRIYRLPDFVFFNHSQHVTAGKIECTTCHGDVKTENRLIQFSTLAMGWCLDCHKTRKVNMSNGYYKTYYKNFVDSLREGKMDSVRVKQTGGWDCMKCHY